MAETVNRKIEDALSDLVDGNIWPLLCPLETYPDKWITYQPEYEDAEDYGDDEDLEWVHHMMIHWFAKGQVNYNTVRSEIRERLREAGFAAGEFQELYETDTKTTHLIYTCCIIEEM